MKAALAYLGLFVAVLAGSAIVDCSRIESPDKDEVYRRIEEIKTKLETQDSCVAEHLDSIRARIEATGDTALYNSVIDDLDDALYHTQEGDEAWFELDELQSELL